MDDLAGFGKAAERFFGLIESSVGALYKPRALRKEGAAAADAEAYKLVALANAKAKADLIQFESQQDLEQRAVNRLRQQELTKQSNIEAIVAAAVNDIGDSKVNQSADKDWLNYFFEACAGVSDEDVQKLWAKVLAKQAISDRGLSRKLVDCLRWTDGPLAEQFMQLAPRIFYFQGFFANDVGLRKDQMTSFSSAFRSRALEEVGLLRENLSKTLEFSFQSLRISCVELSDRSLDLRQFFEFSTAGRELARTVCEPIIQFDKKLSRLLPDSIEQVRRNLGHRLYSDEDVKLDSIIFGIDKRTKLAVSHLAQFLIEIPGEVVIRKNIVRKDKIIDARPVFSVVKKTTNKMIIKRETTGPYLNALHRTEKDFLVTLERVLEANREMICR